MTKSFRFGVQLDPAWSRRAWADRGRAAEDLGYDIALTPDHLGRDAVPPLHVLALLAQATRRLRVGTLVCNNDLRHPTVLAHEAAMVDLLTDGRLELGIGAGCAKDQYDAVGLAFDPPAVRVGRLAEAVTILSGLLSGQHVRQHGVHYRVDHQQAAAAQKPRPPLLIGGDGPRMLGLAGRHADIVGLVGLRSQPDGNLLPTGLGPAAVRTRLDWVRAAAPDRFHRLEVNALVQHVRLTDEPVRVAADLAARLPGVDPRDVLASPYVHLGTARSIADKLREQRDTLGITYPVVFERDMHAMAEVVALLR